MNLLKEKSGKEKILIFVVYCLLVSGIIVWLFQVVPIKATIVLHSSSVSFKIDSTSVTDLDLGNSSNEYEELLVQDVSRLAVDGKTNISIGSCLSIDTTQAVFDIGGSVHMVSPFIINRLLVPKDTRILYSIFDNREVKLEAAPLDSKMNMSVLLSKDNTVVKSEFLCPGNKSGLSLPDSIVIAEQNTEMLFREIDFDEGIGVKLGPGIASFLDNLKIRITGLHSNGNIEGSKVIIQRPNSIENLVTTFGENDTLSLEGKGNTLLVNKFEIDEDKIVLRIQDTFSTLSINETSLLQSRFENYKQEHGTLFYAIMIALFLGLAIVFPEVLEWILNTWKKISI